MWRNLTMGDAPQPPRRRPWPSPRFPADEEEPVADPNGNWFPVAQPGATPDGPEPPPTFDWLFRDSRRWAPQHAARGRDPSALPGPFLPPEPWPPPSAPAETPSPFEPGEYVAPASRRRSRVTLLRELLETVLVAVLVFLAVRASVQHYRVDGASMYPTLEDGQFLLVNSLAYAEVDVERLARFVPGWDPGPPAERYLLHGPERGDIVIFHHPTGVHRDLVKRVIGLPGETVQIRRGTVFINGNALIEPYVNQADPPIGNMAPVRVPEGSYFVMGDNRNQSQDSRVLGPIPGDLIVGRAFLTWWPRDRLGLAPNEAPRFAVADGQATTD
jgi:signal peptidase I